MAKVLRLTPAAQLRIELAQARADLAALHAQQHQRQEAQIADSHIFLDLLVLLQRIPYTPVPIPWYLRVLFCIRPSLAIRWVLTALSAHLIALATARINESFKSIE